MRAKLANTLAVVLCASWALTLAAPATELLDTLHVEDGSPAWGNLRLGMTAEDLERKIGKALELRGIARPSPSHDPESPYHAFTTAIAGCS